MTPRSTWDDFGPLGKEIVVCCLTGRFYSVMSWDHWIEELFTALGKKLGIIVYQIADGMWFWDGNNCFDGQLWSTNNKVVEDTTERSFGKLIDLTVKTSRHLGFPLSCRSSNVWTRPSTLPLKLIHQPPIISILISDKICKDDRFISGLIDPWYSK